MAIPETTLLPTPEPTLLGTFPDLIENSSGSLLWSIACNVLEATMEKGEQLLNTCQGSTGVIRDEKYQALLAVLEEGRFYRDATEQGMRAFRASAEETVCGDGDRPTASIIEGSFRTATNDVREKWNTQVTRLSALESNVNAEKRRRRGDKVGRGKR